MNWFMKRFAFICALSILSGVAFGQGRTLPLIIDHNCTNLSAIPPPYIDSVKVKIKWHYAHTSHGGQLTTGLSRIESNNALYDVSRAGSSLPVTAGALCIYDGQAHDTYITPEEYWESSAGMGYTRDVLNNNSTINVSQWSWCTQVNSYSESRIQSYLDSIATLEAEYPNVTFIYMTGNAQATGSGGYNRYLRNEQIRAYCRTNNKALFDFADLDAWYFNPATEQWEQSTYEYNNVDVPVEHPNFIGNEAGHTTYASCEQKGRAVWWMMARLAGWENTTSVLINHDPGPNDFKLQQNYPNPFNPETTITYTLPAADEVDLSVFNLLGQKVATLVSGRQEAGSYQIRFNGENLVSGIYLYKLETSGRQQVRRMTLIQ